MPFCTQCGHNNPVDSAFCENCGASVKKSTAQTQPAAATLQPSSSLPTTPSRYGNAKKWIIGGTIAVGAIAIVGAGAAWFLRPEAASELTFSKAAQKYVDENKAFVEQEICLTNFAYDRDPVAVNQVDARTQAWLNVLVEGGLYEKPEIRESGGYYSNTQLVYKKTDAGRKATQSRKLCFADGLVVKKIEDLRKPEKLGSTLVSRAVVIFGYKNPMPWTQSVQAQSVMPDRFTREPRETIQFALNKDDKWAVPSPAEAASIQRDTRNVQAHQAAQGNATGGFFQTITGFFSGFGGNPLIGKWRSHIMGQNFLDFEFTTDSMRSDAGVTKVHYEAKGKEVVVFPEGQSYGMIVKFIDNDTISMNMGLAELELKRVR